MGIHNFAVNANTTGNHVGAKAIIIPHFHPNRRLKLSPQMRGIITDATYQSNKQPIANPSMLPNIIRPTAMTLKKIGAVINKSKSDQNPNAFFPS